MTGCRMGSQHRAHVPSKGTVILERELIMYEVLGKGSKKTL